MPSQHSSVRLSRMLVSEELTLCFQSAPQSTVEKAHIVWTENALTVRQSAAHLQLEFFYKRPNKPKNASLRVSMRSPQILRNSPLTSVPTSFSRRNRLSRWRMPRWHCVHQLSLRSRSLSRKVRSYQIFHGFRWAWVFSSRHTWAGLKRNGEMCIQFVGV